MSILNYEEMTLESDTFQAARETFNLMMQKLFRKMEQSDMDEGSIDLKISIELNEDFVPQEDGTTVRIKKPLIKHKISTVVPVKDSADGKRDTGMCLVYDEKLKRYVLKYVSTGGQMNIFDMEQQAENDADIVDSETPAIEGQPTYFLPDNQANEESEEPQEEEQDGETDSMMTVPDMWMRKRIQTFLAAVTKVQTIVVCHYHSARAKMITHTMTRWRNRDVQERKENA